MRDAKRATERQGDAIGRRGFLKLAAVAAPGAAVAAAAGATPAAAAQERPSSLGYVKTEHVKKYLESARF
ncbi:MAG: hypothetical protein AAFR16_15095 [Pseudomonadota bacterium]